MPQNDNGTGRLTGELIASHAAAGGAGVVAMAALPGLGVEPWLAAALGLALAAAVGLLLTANLRHSLELATLAVSRLAEGLPVPALAARPRASLASLLAAVEAVAARSRELDAVRGQALRQARDSATQEERNRLARDLHDSIKQQIFSISTSIAGAQARWEHDQTGARAALDDARRSAQEAMAEMRALLQQLKPVPLENVGLVQALREQSEALGYRTGAHVTAEFGELPDEDRLPPGTTEALFRIAQEALNNIARHARATHVHVRLSPIQEGTGDGGALVMDIQDDGRGFDLGTATGMGLTNMAGRAEEVGAKLEVKSAPDQGTQVIVQVPLLAPGVQEQEATVNSSIRSYITQGKRAQVWAALGFGLALLQVLTAVPYVAKTYPVGGLQGLNLLLGLGVRGILALVGLGIAIRALGRARRAETHLAVMESHASEPLLRLQKEKQGQLLWVFLVAAMILPGTLLRPFDPQFPVAALVLGAAFVGLAGLQIARLYTAAERYWTSLRGSARLRAEIEQAWNQRYVPLLILAITVPAYAYLRFGGEPAGEWFAFPPGRPEVFNMLGILYLFTVMAWAVVSWWQVRRWHMEIAGV